MRSPLRYIERGAPCAKCVICYTLSGGYRVRNLERFCQCKSMGRHRVRTPCRHIAWLRAPRGGRGEGVRYPNSLAGPFCKSGRRWEIKCSREFAIGNRFFHMGIKIKEKEHDNRHRESLFG